MKTIFFSVIFALLAVTTNAQLISVTVDNTTNCWVAVDVLAKDITCTNVAGSTTTVSGLPFSVPYYIAPNTSETFENTDPTAVDFTVYTVMDPAALGGVNIAFPSASNPGGGTGNPNPCVLPGGFGLGGAIPCNAPLTNFHVGSNFVMPTPTITIFAN